MKKKTSLVPQEKADRIALIVSMYPQWTQAEIAEYMHVTVPTVRKAIRQYEIPYISKGKHTIDWNGRSDNYKAIVTIELEARKRGMSYGKFVEERRLKNEI